MPTAVKEDTWQGMSAAQLADKNATHVAARVTSLALASAERRLFPKASGRVTSRNPNLAINFPSSKPRLTARLVVEEEPVNRQDRTRDDFAFSVDTTSTTDHGHFVLMIGSVSAEMIVDSGATCNVMGRDRYIALVQDERRAYLQPSIAAIAPCAPTEARNCKYKVHSAVKCVCTESPITWGAFEWTSSTFG